MATWHLNKALATLEAQMLRKNPGMVIYDIGNEEHRKRVSDHNPNSVGRVNALDFMIRNGFTRLEARDLFVDLIRDARTKFVIFEEQIWSPDSGLRTYHGDNPHNDHVHLSADDWAHAHPEEWNIGNSEEWVMEKLDGYGVPILKYGMNDRNYQGYNSIQRVQRLLAVEADGIYGPQTRDAVKRWFPDSDGKTIGRKEWLALAGIAWVGP
jgi:hypothetical protein